MIQLTDLGGNEVMVRGEAIAVIRLHDPTSPTGTAIFLGGQVQAVRETPAQVIAAIGAAARFEELPQLGGSGAWFNTNAITIIRKSVPQGGTEFYCGGHIQITSLSVSETAQRVS